jgi:hypothetical protein
MAVSGSKDYSITRAEEAALRKLGEYDAGEAVPGDETAAAATALNLMVKEWVARGVDIWLRDEITLFLVPDQKSYSLGTANATRTIAGETTLSSAATASATTLVVASTTGMTAADNIGIKLDDNMFLLTPAPALLLLLVWLLRLRLVRRSTPTQPQSEDPKRLSTPTEETRTI